MNLEEFYHRYIIGWMLAGIKTCTARDSFAAVLLTCCGIEFLGSLCFGRVESLTNDVKNHIRFDKFMGDYMSNIDKRYSEYKGFIWQVFRNGLAHSYFPGKEGGVINADNHRDWHLRLDHPNRRIYIHATVFYEDFQKATEYFYEDLIKNMNGLQGKFDQRFDEIVRKDNEAFQEILEVLSSSSTQTGDSSLYNPDLISAQLTLSNSDSSAIASMYPHRRIDIKPENK